MPKRRVDAMSLSPKVNILAEAPIERNQDVQESGPSKKMETRRRSPRLQERNITQTGLLDATNTIDTVTSPHERVKVLDSPVTSPGVRLNKDQAAMAPEFTALETEHSEPQGRGLAERLSIPSKSHDGNASPSRNRLPTLKGVIREAHYAIDPSCEILDWPYDLVNCWSDLDSSIRATIEHHFHKRPISWSSLGPDTQEKLSRWTPKAEEYLKDPEKRDAIIAACIWHTLDEKVFSADWSTRWSSEPWAAYGTLRESFRCHEEPFRRTSYSKSFSIWKQFSVALATRTTNGTGQGYLHDPSTLAQYIFHDLQDLVGANDDEIAAWSDPMESGGILAQIAHHAREVDAHFQQSKNKYWVAWKPDPALDDSDRKNLWGFRKQNAKLGQMRTLWGHIMGDDDSEGQLVQLVTAPALVVDLFLPDNLYHFAKPMMIVVDDA